MRDPSSSRQFLHSVLAVGSVTDLLKNLRSNQLWQRGNQLGRANGAKSEGVVDSGNGRFFGTFWRNRTTRSLADVSTVGKKSRRREIGGSGLLELALLGARSALAIPL